MESVMANVVVFRLRDDEAIYVADLEAGTVEKTDAADLADESSFVSGVMGAVGDSAGPHVRGIDLAVAASARSLSTSHNMFPSR
jgi:hypothetical protein